MPGAALSGLAAARLHEFCDFPVVRAEISVLLARTHRTRLATVHRWTIPPKSTTVRGIRVTPIAQTLLDIAPRIDELRLERTMDDSLLTGRVAIAALTERLNAYEDSRRPGLSTYRALLAERTEEGYVPTESELETRLLRLIRLVPECGRIVVQPSLPWRPDAAGRLDVLLPDVSALVEGDSRRWHARVRDFDADRERDNEAVLHGLRPLRFTWRHVTARRAMVLDHLHRLSDRPALHPVARCTACRR